MSGQDSLVLSVSEVAILAILHGTSTREMLSHGRNGVTAELLALEAFDVGDDELRGQLGVLAHGVTDSRPSGLGRQIDLRVEGRSHANRHVLFSRDLAELLNQLGVSQCCKTQTFGPLRKFVGAESCHVVSVVDPMNHT